MKKNETMNNPLENKHLSDTFLPYEKLDCLAVNLLNEHSQHLDATTLQGLSVARHLAVNQHQAQVAAVSQSGNILHLLGNGFNDYLEQHRILTSLVIVATLAMSFFAVQQLSADKNLARSDALLLAAELPPEAFADKGFDTWLASKQD